MIVQKETLPRQVRGIRWLRVLGRIGKIRKDSSENLLKGSGRRKKGDGRNMMLVGPTKNAGAMRLGKDTKSVRRQPKKEKGTLGVIFGTEVEAEVQRLVAPILLG